MSILKQLDFTDTSKENSLYERIYIVYKKHMVCFGYVFISKWLNMFMVHISGKSCLIFPSFFIHSALKCSQFENKYLVEYCVGKIYGGVIWKCSEWNYYSPFLKTILKK